MAVSGPAKSCQMGCHGLLIRPSDSVHYMNRRLQNMWTSTSTRVSFVVAHTARFRTAFGCTSYTENLYYKTLYTCPYHSLPMLIHVSACDIRNSGFLSKHLSPLSFAEKKREIYFAINSAFFYVVRKLRWGKGKHFSFFTSAHREQLQRVHTSTRFHTIPLI